MRTNKSISISIDAAEEIKKMEKQIPKFNFSLECEKLVFALKKRYKIK